MSGGNGGRELGNDPLPHGFDRLLEQFDGKTKNFEKYFALLLGVSLFILMFMLIPYVSNQIMKQDLSEQRNNIDKELKNLTNSLHTLQESVDRMNDLDEDINKYPQKLREYIIGIVNKNTTLVQGTIDESDINNPGQQAQQGQGSNIVNPAYNYKECSSLLPSTNNGSKSKQWIDCMVNQHVRKDLNDYTIRLNNSVSPIYEIHNTSINKTIDFSQFNVELRELNSTLFERFQQNLLFWISYEGKADFTVQIDEDIQNFWNKYEQAINTLIINTESLITKFEDDQENLINISSQLDNKQKNITQMLNEFESPIGKLTIGFDTLIIYFPVALAGGFSVCASLLINTIRIRKDLMKFHNKDTDIDYDTRQRIVSIAPLWIDAENKRQNKRIRFLILLLPLIIFISICVLIFVSWSISQSQPIDVDPQYQIWYGFTYTFLGAIFFGYSYSKIVEESGLRH